MSDDRRVPVLITGDAEADLGRLAFSVRAPTIVARGISAGCAALRSSAVGAVVVDVRTGDDAFAILRAAGRARPAPRVVCLVAADFSGQLDVASLIARAAFAVRRHPVTSAEVDRLVAEAVADFGSAESETHAPRSASVAQAVRAGWSDAEYQLADALRSVVAALTGSRADGMAEEVISRCVSAASEAARDGADGQMLLRALAGALEVELPDRAGQDEEAAA